MAQRLQLNATRARKHIRPNSVLLFAMSIPFLIFIFAFNYIPLFGWAYAMFDYKPGISLFECEFVGLKYFSLVFSQGSAMRQVFINTLVMAFLNLLFTPLPIIFAIMITEAPSKYFQKIVQTTTTLPHFVSWIIVFSLSFNMFSTDGVLNKVLLGLGLIKRPVNLLGNGDIVWFFQTGLQIWKGLGWSAIIYMAAIAGIDSELYDAANVDGAGRFRRIWHITVPGVASTYLVQLLLSASNILSVGFDQYMLFYNGLVAEKITVLDLYVYRVGLLSNDYSYAIAIGIFKTIISITLLFTVNYISKRIRGNSII